MTGQIERIRVFVEVAERQSFAAAARALALTPSQATRHVAELEADLGVRLLVRTTRQVTLSGAGQQYLQRVKPLLAELARVDEVARVQANTLKGEIRVSVPISFGMRFLPDAISQFRILYPEVRLKLNLTDSFVDMMSGEVDMALRISGPPSDKTSIWRKIQPVPRLLAASPSYLARRGEPANPSDLEECDCLVYEDKADGASWELRRAGSDEIRTANVASCFSCNNGDLIGELAARGEGIALLPRFIIADHLARGALVEVLAGWQAPQIWLAAFYPPYDHLPAKVETFTRFVEGAVKGDPGVLG